MKITLKQQWCGHVKGAEVSVSDERAYVLMAAKIAEPDMEYLEARKKEIERLLKEAEKRGKRK